MGIVLDVIILSILALSIFLGYKRGLVGVAFNLCAFLVAIVLTWVLYTPISNFVIQNTQIDEGIKNAIVEKGVIKIDNKEDKKEKEEDMVSSYINEYVAIPAAEKTNQAIEETAKFISEKIVAIGVGIALFIVIRILLILLKFIAEAIAELPLIKQFNKAGGLIYGVISGFFIIYVILAILFLVMSINNSGMVAEMINSSFISKYLYTNNLILNIIF